MGRVVTDRAAVYSVIDGERDYQNELGPDRTDSSQKSVGDFLSLMRSYLNDADKAFATNPGTVPTLHEIRKVTALGVRCLEEHGAPPRE